ncbi:MAG TPA: helix-turn-helix transcriptional regulator [Pirellulales bacterium]|nr:helix-turn-helix transcriptional regulator [Pirellulales bacterium]
MSLSELDAQGFRTGPATPNDASAPERQLHRIQEVRQQQGVSLRRVGQILHTDIRELRREEEPAADLPISRLYQWQAALEVPVADLLVDTGVGLSTPVLERARLVRIMKTVAAIQEKAPNTSIQRLAQTLVEQVLEIMPELKGINPWHSVGQRRSLEEYGRIVERTYSDQMWNEP